MENPSYYAVIPAEIRYAKNLSMFQKLLYAEITALTQKDWYCRASNSYFAKLYDCHITTISRAISDLEKKWFLKLEIEIEKWNQRKIFVWEIVEKKAKTVNSPISKNANTYKQKSQDPISKNAKHNNINIINKKNNNNSKELLLQKTQNFKEIFEEKILKNKEFLTKIFEKFTFLNDEIFLDISEDFLIYRTAESEKKGKLLWEIQPTFDFKRRIYTWLKNKRNKLYSKNQKKKVTISW